MNKFPEILTVEKINERNIDVQNALIQLNKSSIDADNFHHLIHIYNATKNLSFRNKILKLLYDFDFAELKDFFSNAYKRERYLDMKLHALRGLSRFVTEKDVAKLLEKFNATLVKSQETTPHNYQVYELLRGKNALPYLTEKYGYHCFKETLTQVNKQYDAMPEAFKGHFTTDENGTIISLRKPGEAKAIMEAFYEEDRKKYMKNQ